MAERRPQGVELKTEEERDERQKEVLIPWLGFWQDQRTVSEGGFMNNVRFILVAFIAALTLLSSTPLHAADLAGAASPTELGRRYSEALARKDLNAYGLLVCWDRVLPRERKSLESGFTSQASDNVTDFRFLTLQQMDQEAQKAGAMAPVRKPVERDGISLDHTYPSSATLLTTSGARTAKSRATRRFP
jgi:hypothetical protein